MKTVEIGFCRHKYKLWGRSEPSYGFIKYVDTESLKPMILLINLDTKKLDNSQFSSYTVLWSTVTTVHELKLKYWDMGSGDLGAFSALLGHSKTNKSIVELMEAVK